MIEKPKPRGTLAATTARLAGLWILSGALFKLLAGTPADLPQVVRDLPLDLGLTYKLAISAELCVSFLVLLNPRVGWIPLALMLLVFEIVVVTQIAAGDASCGCFGSQVTIPPWVMLAIDGALLVGLLLGKPWVKHESRGPRIVTVAVMFAAAAVLPWFLERQATGEVASEDGPLRNWVELDVKKWKGATIFDTPLAEPPLAEYIDVNGLPLDGLWIFYRYTCEHCAEHLEDLADRATGDTLLTLIRLQEPHDTEANRVVFRMPDGDHVMHATLPDRWDYVVTTPAELWLEGGTVVDAKEAVSPNEGLLPR